MLDPRYNPPYRLPKNPRDWIDPRRIEMQLNRQRTLEQARNNPNDPMNWRNPRLTEMELNSNTIPQNTIRMITSSQPSESYELEQKLKENWSVKIRFLNQNVKDFVIETLSYSVSITTKMLMLIEEQSALRKKGLLNDAKNIQPYINYLALVADSLSGPMEPPMFLKYVLYGDIRVFPENDPKIIQLKDEKSEVWQSFEFPPNSYQHWNDIVTHKKATLDIKILYHVDISNDEGLKIIDSVHTWTK